MYNKSYTSPITEMRDHCQSNLSVRHKEMIDIEVERELWKLVSVVGPLPRAMVIHALNCSDWIPGDPLPSVSTVGTENIALGERVVGQFRLCWTNLVSNGFSPTKQDFLDAVNRLPSSIVQ